LYKKRRLFVLWVTVFVSVSLFTVTVALLSQKMAKRVQSASDQPSSITGVQLVKNEQSGPLIPVLLTKRQMTVQVPLEAYVRGVLAAEMPIDFQPEAMKAQAIASRTYIVRHMLDRELRSVPLKDATVTDSIAHQAYITDEELKERWKERYEANMDRLNRVVEETKDLILTYNGQPINATFFSTSNGYTENSEDYWGNYVPYLRSVSSPWDQKLSPRFKETIRVTAKELKDKLGLTAVPVSTNNAFMKVLERTQGNRIKKITAGGKSYSGREIREKLELNSSQFEWVWSGTDLLITTYGYGHGVGMSQWGANGMAMEGSKAEEIVKHYYTGVSLSRASSYINKTAN
jgi:stage II sporulation protein D